MIPSYHPPVNRGLVSHPPSPIFGDFFDAVRGRALGAFVTVTAFGIPFGPVDVGADRDDMTTSQNAEPLVRMPSGMLDPEPIDDLSNFVGDCLSHRALL
jgi:hypothetical protein